MLPLPSPARSGRSPRDGRTGLSSGADRPAALPAAGRRVVTASQPSVSASSLAASTMSRLRSARSRSLRVWIGMGQILATLDAWSTLC
ncbi:hypothetical protein KNE206_62480 [Kitasatospora sp. NE20-6]